MGIGHEIAKELSGIGDIPREGKAFVGESKGKVNVVELGEVDVGAGCPVDVVGHDQGPNVGICSL